MGYFKEEQIEEIEMHFQDQFSFSSMKEFYLCSEMQLEEFLSETNKELFTPDRWTLSLFEQAKSA
jgi:hypothetical protein